MKGGRLRISLLLAAVLAVSFSIVLLWPAQETRHGPDTVTETPETAAISLPSIGNQQASELVSLIDYHAWRPLPALLHDLDVEGNGRIDGTDLQRLAAMAADGEGPPDLNLDGGGDELDLQLADMIVGFAGTVGYLDFNSDGRVDVSDYRLPVDAGSLLGSFYPPGKADQVAAAGARAWLVSSEGYNLTGVDPSGEDMALQIGLPGLRLGETSAGLRDRVPEEVGGGERVMVLVTGTGRGETAGHRLEIRFKHDSLSLTLPRSIETDAGDVQWLLWGGLIWKRKGDSFISHSPLPSSLMSAYAAESSPPAWPWWSLLIAGARAQSAGEGIGESTATQLLSLESRVRRRQEELDGRIARLEQGLATAGDKGRQCVGYDCDALGPVLSAAEEMAAVSRGARILARQAVAHARRVSDRHRTAVAAIAEGREEVAGILARQQFFIRAGDVAADLLDALVTQDYTEIGLDLLNYGTAYAADQAVGHQQALDSAGRRAAPDNEALQRFAGKLSAGLGKFGAFAADKSSGKVVFKPNVGATASIGHLGKLREAGASPAEIRRARMAILGPLIKGVIAAATSEAVNRTRRDLERVSRDLARARSGQMQFQLALRLYRQFVPRIDKLHRDNMALRDRLHDLRQDCEYRHRRAECADRLEKALKEAAAKHDRINADTEKRLARHDRAVAGLKRQREEHFQEVRNVHRQVRSAILSGEQDRAERLQQQRAGIWQREAEVRNELYRARAQRRQARMDSEASLNKAHAVYLDTVFSARREFFDCTGSSISVPPRPPAAETPEAGRGLIPVPALYDPVIAALGSLNERLSSASLRVVDRRDCPGDEHISAAGPQGNRLDSSISGCWEMDAVHEDGGGYVYDPHLVLALRVDPQGLAEARVGRARTAVGYEVYDGSYPHEIPTITYTGRLDWPVLRLRHDYDSVRGMSVFDAGFADSPEKARFLINNGVRSTLEIRFRSEEKPDSPDADHRFVGADLDPAVGWRFLLDRDGSQQWFAAAAELLMYSHSAITVDDESGRHYELDEVYSRRWEDEVDAVADGFHNSLRLRPFSRMVSEIRELAFTTADLESGISEIRDGAPLGIRALAGNNCHAQTENLFIRLQANQYHDLVDRDGTANLMRLTETSPDSGILATPAGGIVPDIRLKPDYDPREPSPFGAPALIIESGDLRDEVIVKPGP